MDSRTIYLDVLRVIATLSVVILHISAVHWYSTPVDGFTWQVYNIYDSAVRFCVPIFFMISGAVFLVPERRISISSLFKKNILRLVVAYVIYSAFYAVYVGILKDQSWDQIKEAFVKSNYHLWFLPSLASIYMLVPILRLVVKDRKVTEYVIIVSFIVTIVLYSVGLVPELGFVRTITNKFSLNYFSGYLSYFLIGHYLYTYDISAKYRKIAYVLWFVGTMMVIVLTSLESIATEAPISKYYSYFFIGVAFQAIPIFIFFKYNTDAFLARFNISRFIIWVTPYLFGVYLVHDIFIRAFIEIKFTPKYFNALISVPVVALAVFVCSLILSYLLNRIPVINKYIA